MKLSTILISACVLFGPAPPVAASSSRSAIPTPKKRTSQLPFKVPRGGAGLPLDRLVMAKTSATSLLAIHSLAVLAPEAFLKGY